MNKPGYKKPIFVPKKRSAPRPISSTTTTTISVEALVDDSHNEDENDLIEHPPTCPWFATSKVIMWINFVFTLVLFMAFLIYVLTRPTLPSLMEKSMETTRGNTQEGGTKSFNLISHPETTISLKNLNLSISLLKRIWVCCTKDNIYSCNGWDVKIHLETLEAKVTFKHSDKIGAACILHWI